ncbi:MAG TPA: VOC family protein [Chthonomonadales bacterium]|nr:VOC family protein [Chthonomonadales bacterium]
MPSTGPNGLGFHHVAMKVADLEASVRFYVSGLGMAQVYSWGEGDQRAAVLDMGDGGMIEIFAGGSGDAAGRPEGALLHLALRAHDTDESFRRALMAGAKPTMDPTDVTIDGTPPKKVRIAFCKGPDGEVLEFFQSDDL